MPPHAFWERQPQHWERHPINPRSPSSLSDRGRHIFFKILVCFQSSGKISILFRFVYKLLRFLIQATEENKGKRKALCFFDVYSHLRFGREYSVWARAQDKLPTPREKFNLQPGDIIYPSNRCSFFQRGIAPSCSPSYISLQPISTGTGVNNTVTDVKVPETIMSQSRLADPQGVIRPR